jgi:hypothetical protein
VREWSFLKVNFGIGCYGERVRSPFIQPAFHQLHARGKARFPPSLSLSLFRPFLSPYNRHARLPLCFPFRARVIPHRLASPLYDDDARCTRRIARVNAREKESTSTMKKERESAQGQRAKGGSLLRFTDARAHDSCLHEWKVLLVSCRSGALVQWSTGNAWLHPVSVRGPATTCREITEWNATGRPEEERQEVYRRRNRGNYV